MGGQSGEMSIFVAKFGGTSLASAEAFRKVKEIVYADHRRCFVVDSAPGKRFDLDSKVTDLLYECHERIKHGQDFDPVFALISERYREIVRELGLSLNIDAWLSQIYQQMQRETSPDYAASRGEFLNGLILAEYLGYEFIDATEVIRFTADGFLDLEQSEALIRQKLDPKRPAVIPGFYGVMPDGSIKTFSRGGSDITGAVIARGVRAELYENWTDVSGFYMADPRIVPQPKLIKLITYSELRELAYNGANVLHEAAIYPVSQVGIPINIRNTNQPEEPGTLIVKELTEPRDCGEIVGVAGQKDFVIISIEKALMNSQLGFVRRLLSILEELKISFAHLPSGIDVVSLVIHSSELKEKLDQVLARIEERLAPDKIEVVTDIALIATVGQGMAYRSGIAAKVFNALGKAAINVRMIDQGASGLNLIVGVENKDFIAAVRAIYNAFVN